MNNRLKESRTRVAIRQINLAIAQLATHEINHYAITNKLDVLLIQEPYTHQGRVTGLGPGVRVAQASNGTPWAEIAVYRDWDTPRLPSWRGSTSGPGKSESIWSACTARKEDGTRGTSGDR